MISLYGDGMSMEAIARLTGYNSTRVRRVLTDAGIAIRPNPYVLTPEVIEEMVRLKATGLRNTDLAQRYRVTHQAISRALRPHRTTTASTTA